EGKHECLRALGITLTKQLIITSKMQHQRVILFMILSVVAVLVADAHHSYYYKWRSHHYHRPQWKVRYFYYEPGTGKSFMPMQKYPVFNHKKPKSMPGHTMDGGNLHPGNGEKEPEVPSILDVVDVRHGIRAS
ncbi:hypothetical protein OTU49_017015, partial [Cherax quadricarinatus]